MAIIRYLLAVLAAALSPLYPLNAAWAQDYPTRPVRVIVPFSPGGAVDGPMRVIAQELSKRLGQQVVVENKPGAGATIGTELVAKAAPDGYTLLLASQTNAISATLYSKLAFDPIEDFAPIIADRARARRARRQPGAAGEDARRNSSRYAKERPGQVDYASSGQRQRPAPVRRAARVDDRHEDEPHSVQGQRPGDDRSAIAAQVPMSIPGTAGMVGHIKAGKLRALAVTGATSLAATARCADGDGSPACRATRPTCGWACSRRRARRPRSSSGSSARCSRCSRDDEVKRYMANAGIEIVGSTPAEFGTFFRSEKDLWAKVIRDTGAKID